MESIGILTGQYVTIKMEPASIISRIGALLLDYFFIFIYLFALLYTFFEIMDIRVYSTPDDILITLAVIFWLPVFTYHFLFESLLGGRTPGKMILGIRVTKVDGTPPGLLSYFLRWILMPIDMLFSGGVGVIFILLSAKHQRLGDLAAGTVVVYSNMKLNLNLDELYFEFPSNYQPTFKEVEILSNGQIAFISDFLINPGSKKAVEASIENLSQKVKRILKIKSGLDDRTFLETIVKDYNYYASLEI